MTQEISSDALSALLARQREAFLHQGPPSADLRSDRLARLDAAIAGNIKRIEEAISDDFGHRSPIETDIGEILMVRRAIAHAQRHLKRWMRVRRRPTPWLFRPARSEIHRQPLGVVGIVAPWNYPVQLALNPLVGALAAGNRAMIKTSEHTPATAQLLTEIAADNFEATELAICPGGVETARAFTALPFDHLIFTGSTAVGRQVMRAAADNLTPVTLELGGKCPALVARDAPLEQAARRIMRGKLFNAGQTCVAPDYALVPEGRLDSFVAACKAAVKDSYGKGLMDNPDYSALIHDRHYGRLVEALEEAEAGGATLHRVTPRDDHPPRNSGKMAPVIATDVPADSVLGREEIFGPILPVWPVSDIDEAIRFVNARPRPLALYLFSRQAETTEQVLARTTSGGVTLNETILHVAQDDLPFGGVGASGMGAYHGETGFAALSHEKAVFRQGRPALTGALAPPYGPVKRRLVRRLTGKR